MNRVVRSTNVADRGAVKSDDEVAFPVSRNRAVLGGPLADRDVGADKLLAATPAASPRHAQRPPGAQAGRQLAAQCPPPLDVQRLVDGLVRDPHRVIVGIRYPEPMGDLLRAPRCRPMSVLAAALTSTTPGADVWARHGRPVLSHHRACEAVLHVAPQPIVRGQLGDLRALGTSGAVPLRSRRPITPDRRSESPRCDAALARQSTGLSGADGQCRAPRRPELSGSRSLPAPQRTGSEPIGAPS